MLSFTKAEMLQHLTGKLSNFKIAPLMRFTAFDYEKNPDKILKGVQSFFKIAGPYVIVRSSSLSEDGQYSSNAGKFESILNVDSQNYSALNESIIKVCKALRLSRESCDGDQILIQTMISDVVISGVLFTQELTSGAPYISINYDDVSGLTDTVTSGKGEFSNKSLFISRKKTELIRSRRFKKLVEAVFELESYLSCEQLDIEFAIDQNDDIFLFQVRPITVGNQWTKHQHSLLYEMLEDAQTYLNERLKCAPIDGCSDTLLGQMPDWNPVEILGQAPSELSQCLYNELITVDVWSKAREIMGYFRPKNRSLLVNVAGHLYVDVGLSFSSFLPSALDAKVRAKLVNHWIDRLRLNPELHDKVEFEVAITCYTFNMSEQIERYAHRVLSDVEASQVQLCFFEQLNRLLFESGEHSMNAALNKVEKLNQLQLSDGYFSGKRTSALINRILKDCKNLGTLPFAILARYAFIVRSLVISLVEQELLTQSECDRLMNSVHTVASDFVKDMALTRAGKMEEDKFWKIYGHLRPGSYDINSPRYDHTPKMFFSDEEQKTNESNVSFSPERGLELSKHRQKEIEKYFADNGFSSLTWKEFERFVCQAIEAREYSKFIFTRSLSGLIEIIVEIGNENSLSKEQLSQLSLHEVIELADSTHGTVPQHVLQSIKEKQLRHNISKAIKLPQILGEAEGAYIAPFQSNRPNFITSLSVTRGVQYLSPSDKIIDLEVEGKIVLIDSADPGFDWIFSRNIAGLITQFGGANSHMAIRSAEFGLPAAIGCGWNIFESLKGASVVRLDCSSSMITVIN